MMRKKSAVVILVGAASFLLFGVVVEVSHVRADTVAFWTFNEKEVGQAAVDGDSVLDTSGSANVHDGFVVADSGDDAPYVEGVPGFSDGVAMSFERGPGAHPAEGINDGVAIFGHDDFTYTKSDSYTIEVMMRSTQVTGGVPGDTQGTGPISTLMGSFWLDDDVPGAVMFATGFGEKEDPDYGDQETRAKLWTTTLVNDGQWHHVAGVFDGTAQYVRLYVDGEEEASMDVSDFMSLPSWNETKGTGAGEVGYLGTSGQQLVIREYEGDLDFVRISRDALAPENFFMPGEDLEGDLNSDGFVGGDDLDIVRSFWGQTVEEGNLSQGDPSNDGFVGGDDLDIVRANWGEGTPPSPGVVPEPSTGMMLCVGALLAVWAGLRSTKDRRG